MPRALPALSSDFAPVLPRGLPRPVRSSFQLWPDLGDHLPKVRSAVEVRGISLSKPRKRSSQNLQSNVQASKSRIPNEGRHPWTAPAPEANHKPRNGSCAGETEAGRKWEFSS